MQPAREEAGMTRQALTLGINAYPRSPLQGCRADANDWAQALADRGFEVMTLLDEQATRQAILGSIANLLNRSGPADIAFITYSGHGTQVPDRDGDELDRMDEAIVPVDYDRSGMILDDDLFRLFSEADARGVRVIFVADSCFSGTIQRLAAPLSLATLTEIDRSAEFAYRKARWLPPELWVQDEDDWQAIRQAAPTGLLVPRGRPRRSALAFTGCRDDQVSYDAYLGGRYRGAFTAAALQALETFDEAGGGTYRRWYGMIRDLLPSEDFDQVPTLEGSSTQKRWIAFQEQGRR
jgi:metacaspase-1